MKFLVPLIALILLFATSCGYNRIRFTKVAETEKSAPKNVSTESTQPSRNVLFDNSKVEKVEETPLEIESTESEIIILEVESIQRNSIPTDTIKVVDDVTDEVVYQAQLATKRASTAKIFFITGTMMLFIISFFAIILTAFGLWFYIKSKRSRFITQEGESELRKAKIALIINITVLILLALLVTVLFLLIF